MDNGVHNSSNRETHWLPISYRFVCDKYDRNIGVPIICSTAFAALLLTYTKRVYIFLNAHLNRTNYYSPQPARYGDLYTSLSDTLNLQLQLLRAHALC